MRLKLVVLSSVLAAIVAAGLSFILIRILDGYWGRLITSQLVRQHSIDIVVLVTPIIVSNLVSGLFVYRHTARKRKTQVLITVTVGLLLSIVMLSTLGWLFPRA